MTNTIYQDLGVSTLINCATTYTRFGGSIMPREIAQAMADAADAFVSVDELQLAVGKRLAELTRNESAYVTNGAAAGLALATAACMTGDDPSLMARLPNRTDGMKNQVVVHREQRNWYDIAIRQVGVELVEIGHSMETYPWELDAAITDRTAAVFYFAGSHFNRFTLPLEYVVEVARSRGVPVIVDGAAQLPPVSNLWQFTREMGADVALFSGGKMLRGPQNSGLAVGRESTIANMRLNGPPVQRIGRAMKVSKEAIIGLFKAVELFLETDHDAQSLVWSETVDGWLLDWEPVAPNWIHVYRLDTNEAGEPIPRIILHVAPGSPIDRNDLVDALRAGDPPIEVVVDLRDSIALSPHVLREGEREVVSERVRELLARYRVEMEPGTLVGNHVRSG